MSDIVEVMARAIRDFRASYTRFPSSEELAACALTALSEGGWVVTKREPDEEMRMAGRQQMYDGGGPSAIFHAMLAASDPTAGQMPEESR